MYFYGVVSSDGVCYQVGLSKKMSLGLLQRFQLCVVFIVEMFINGSFIESYSTCSVSIFCFMTFHNASLLEVISPSSFYWLA